MKKALLTANNYPGTTYPLRGCLNDQALMLSILKDFDEIYTISNENCTYQGYLKGLEWLFKDAQDEDFMIWHNSSHGTQVDDAEGVMIGYTAQSARCVGYVEISANDNILSMTIGGASGGIASGSYVELWKTGELR